MKDADLDELIEQARDKLKQAEYILEQAEGTEYVRKCHKAVRLCAEEVDRLTLRRTTHKR